jgi:putative addiction module component (TIGR02574 family)
MELVMMPQSEQILRDALALTPAERAELVEQILASIDFPARQGIDAAWAREAEARIDAYEQGQIKTVPAEDVFGEIDRQAQE